MQETTLFVGRLTVIDFSYLHESRGLLGESWIVDVELSGNLDSDGVIFDFGDAKKKIKAVIDQSIDHTLVVPQKSKALRIKIDENQIELAYSYAQDELKIEAPSTSFFLAETESISIQSITPILEQLILNAMPKNVTKVTLLLRTENLDTPFYHYSHGLKKHDGNCQRIAHGHRSKIDIYINDQYANELVATWAEMLKDSYFITEEDIERETNESYQISYQASQGHFRLSIPKKQCILMKNETTVEQIAHFIADKIKEKNPNDLISVRAYEGVEKGAISKRV